MDESRPPEDGGSPDQCLELRLPATRGAPRVARRIVGAAAAEWAPRAAQGDVSLAVSELVTNAVLHGGPTVSLRLTVRGGQLCIQVSDAGAGRPRAPADDEDTSGRGLRIIEALSTRSGWYAEPPAPGKAVWALLA